MVVTDLDGRASCHRLGLDLFATPVWPKHTFIAGTGGAQIQVRMGSDKKLLKYSRGKVSVLYSSLRCQSCSSDPGMCDFTNGPVSQLHLLAGLDLRIVVKSGRLYE